MSPTGRIDWASLSRRASMGDLQRQSAMNAINLWSSGRTLTEDSNAAERRRAAALRAAYARMGAKRAETLADAEAQHRRAIELERLRQGGREGLLERRATFAETRLGEQERIGDERLSLTLAEREEARKEAGSWKEKAAAAAIEAARVAAERAKERAANTPAARQAAFEAREAEARRLEAERDARFGDDEQATAFLTDLQGEIAVESSKRKSDEDYRQRRDAEMAQARAEAAAESKRRYEEGVVRGRDAEIGRATRSGLAADERRAQGVTRRFDSWRKYLTGLAARPASAAILEYPWLEDATEETIRAKAAEYAGAGWGAPGDDAGGKPGPGNLIPEDRGGAGGGPFDASVPIPGTALSPADAQAGPFDPIPGAPPSTFSPVQRPRAYAPTPPPGLDMSNVLGHDALSRAMSPESDPIEAARARLSAQHELERGGPFPNDPNRVRVGAMQAIGGAMRGPGAIGGVFDVPEPSLPSRLPEPTPSAMLGAPPDAIDMAMFRAPTMQDIGRLGRSDPIGDRLAEIETGPSGQEAVREANARTAPMDPRTTSAAWRYGPTPDRPYKGRTGPGSVARIVPEPTWDERVDATPLPSSSGRYVPREMEVSRPSPRGAAYAEDVATGQRADATSVMANMLRAKNEPAARLAIMELQANPEETARRGIDLEAILAEFGGFGSEA